jgi:Cache domain
MTADPATPAVAVPAAPVPGVAVPAVAVPAAPVPAAPVPAAPVPAAAVPAAAAGAALLASVTGAIAGVMDSVAALGAEMVALAAAAESGKRPLRQGDLAPLRPHAAGVLHRHQPLVAGAGVVLAPAVLAGAPRWIQWWWADEQGTVNQLDVDLDPGSAEFYDYTTTEWYREPARTGRQWVTGPYVDYICTRKYTFTLSSPLLLAGRFLGVAGADILADRVEHLAMPGLVALGGTAVLVSGNGRVIASNDAAVRPGAILARHPAASALRRTAGPLPPPATREPGTSPGATLPWVLLETRDPT